MRPIRNVLLLALAFGGMAACSSTSGSSGTTDGDTGNAAATTDVVPSDDTTTPTTDTAELGDTQTGPPDTGPAGCTSNADCSAPEAPMCNLATGACEASPLGTAIGTGDGSPGSITLTEIFKPTNSVEATDLEFDPMEPDRLWVLIREKFNAAGCPETGATQAGCQSMEGKLYMITAPGTPEQTEQLKTDPNGWHFMRRPSSMAMGDPTHQGATTFATCPEERSCNFTDGAADFCGPSLWSADPALFGVQPPGGNGSHLDMLHATPYCMGMAHQSDNIYWVFNGQSSSIDRYDFAGDHGPGNADHSDGNVTRYAIGFVTRVAGIPSHMVFDSETSQLYVNDTGNGRIMRLDTTTGKVGGPIPNNYDGLTGAVIMTGAISPGVTPPNTFQANSGMAMHEGLLYITDNKTSEVHAVDLNGTIVRSLQLDLPEGSLGGMTFGPDGKLYLANLLTGAVYRIDP